MTKLKCVVTSDLHGNLIDIPECELLLICGDIVPLEIQRDLGLSSKWLITTFKNWAENLPCDKVIFIAGNHDFVLDERWFAFKKSFPEFEKVTFLRNELYSYLSKSGKKYNIFGYSICSLRNWAYYKDGTELLDIIMTIPSGLDILLSHEAPAMLNLDTTEFGDKFGNILLADRILQVQPKYCFCGHIHTGKHELQEFNGMYFANTSLLNEQYGIKFNPLEIEI